MSTPEITRTTRGDLETTSTSVGQDSHERLSSSVTAMAIEQVLAEQGVRATLSDIVQGAQLFESAIVHSGSRLKPEHLW